MGTMIADRTMVEPGKAAASSPTTGDPRPTAARKTPQRLVRINPTVSWYGKILIVGALLVAFGWELFHLVITLLTLD
ncbi:hypothetical protein [Bradyrhizobium yuanmingense]|uniref:ABC transporter permease n=1 Tax=Bradyrhizobium yuanmingense TaxID=108015 RepID=A0ABV4GBH3_9BRAD|nr:hypothetical protein [Bradyrhizobium yuanmingense]